MKKPIKVDVFGGGGEPLTEEMFTRGMEALVREWLHPRPYEAPARPIGLRDVLAAEAWERSLVKGES